MAKREELSALEIDQLAVKLASNWRELPGWSWSTYRPDDPDDWTVQRMIDPADKSINYSVLYGVYAQVEPYLEHTLAWIGEAMKQGKAVQPFARRIYEETRGRADAKAIQGSNLARGWYSHIAARVWKRDSERTTQAFSTLVRAMHGFGMPFTTLREMRLSESAHRVAAARGRAIARGEAPVTFGDRYAAETETIQNIEDAGDRLMSREVDWSEPDRRQLRLTDTLTRGGEDVRWDFPESRPRKDMSLLRTIFVQTEDGYELDVDVDITDDYASDLPTSWPTLVYFWMQTHMPGEVQSVEEGVPAKPSDAVVREAMLAMTKYVIGFDYKDPPESEELEEALQRAAHNKAEDLCEEMRDEDRRNARDEDEEAISDLGDEWVDEDEAPDDWAKQVYGWLDGRYLDSDSTTSHEGYLDEEMVKKALDALGWLWDEVEAEKERVAEWKENTITWIRDEFTVDLAPASTRGPSMRYDGTDDWWYNQVYRWLARNMPNTLEDSPNVDSLDFDERPEHAYPEIQQVKRAMRALGILDPGRHQSWWPTDQLDGNKDLLNGPDMTEEPDHWSKGFTPNLADDGGAVIDSEVYVAMDVVKSTPKDEVDAALRAHFEGDYGEVDNATYAESTENGKLTTGRVESRHGRLRIVTDPTHYATNVSIRR